jgi:hypothetical protein
VTTVVAGHGALLESRLGFKAEGNIKDLGGLSTYMRRYGYRAVFLLEGDDDIDNDGEANPPVNQQRRREPPVPQISQAQEEAMRQPARGQVYPGMRGQETRQETRQQPPAQAQQGKPVQQAPVPQKPLSVVPPPAGDRPTSRPPSQRVGTIPPPGKEAVEACSREQLDQINKLAIQLGWKRDEIYDQVKELAQQDETGRSWNPKFLERYQAERMIGVLRSLVETKSNLEQAGLR